MRMSYFNIDNTVDVGVFLGALIFVASEGFGSYARPLGSFLVVCSWLNLSSFLTQLPLEIGLHIVMFTKILWTVANLGLLFFIFIVAFGLGFHIILHNEVAAPESGFADNIFWSFLKSYVMMIGEMDYGGLIVDKCFILFMVND